MIPSGRGRERMHGVSWPRRPCTLRVAEIENAPDSMCLKVRQGNRGKDRYTLCRRGPDRSLKPQSSSQGVEFGVCYT